MPQCVPFTIALKPSSERSAISKSTCWFGVYFAGVLSSHLLNLVVLTIRPDALSV